MEKGDITPEGIAILERISRNMPTRTAMHQGKVETDYGPVYIALGKGYGDSFPDMYWYGVYALGGLARTFEVRGDKTLKEAQQIGLDDAIWFAAELDKREFFHA